MEANDALQEVNNFNSASLFFKYFISDPCVDNQNQYDSKGLVRVGPDDNGV